MFCSDSCRTRSYQLRRQEAKRLNARKVPIREIARRLGSDVPTIKGWIKKEK